MKENVVNNWPQSSSFSKKTLSKAGLRPRGDGNQSVPAFKNGISLPETSGQ